MKSIQSSSMRLLAIGGTALTLLTACESANHSTAAGYYDMGIYDPWYYGDYYYHYEDPDIIVTPPDSPGDAPRPTHPIALPPASTAPRPTPMPSMPSMPAPRPSMRR